jgi:hypothetical protein
MSGTKAIDKSGFSPKKRHISLHKERLNSYTQFFVNMSIKHTDMGLFYKKYDKRVLKDLNDIVKAVIIPALNSRGFVLKPFSNSWSGDFDRENQSYHYELGRISNEGNLELIDLYVSKGSRWIPISLNVFKLSPKPSSIHKLSLQTRSSLGIPLNGKTEMRLLSDDYLGPPIFYSFHPVHKLGSYYSNTGYLAALEQFKKLLQKDMENIDHFVQTWHKIHQPNHVDWEGNVIVE